MDPTLLEIVLRQSPSLRAASLQDEIGWISITIVPCSAARICMAMMMMIMLTMMMMMITTCSVVQLSPSWGFAHQCACKCQLWSSSVFDKNPVVSSEPGPIYAWPTLTYGFQDLMWPWFVMIVTYQVTPRIPSEEKMRNCSLGPCRLCRCLIGGAWMNFCE